MPMSAVTPRNDLWKLAVAVGACLLVGALGSVATMPQLPGWYAELTKPAWNPPNSVFGPVWTTLYVMMGIAAWLVWRTGKHLDTTRALLAFSLQLALNLAWSFLFFAAQSPLAGLIDIVLLWAAIVWTIRLSARRSVLAAWLMAPYLAWVSYALTLNVGIWWLNR